MFSLVITIISIALVALLALATIYFGGPAMQRASADANATSLINQGAQIIGAAELFYVEQKAWSHSLESLVEGEYLTAIPTYQRLEWAQPMPGTVVYWSLKNTEKDACRTVNKKTRGDDGIYNKAKLGYVIQCFGTAEPFTTIITRQGLPDDLSLQQAIEYANQPDVGFAADGDGWSVPPTGWGEEATPPTDETAPPAPFHATLTNISTAPIPVTLVNTTSAVKQEIKILSSGVVALPVTEVAIEGSSAFTLDHDCPSSLEPGAFCTADISFTPATKGTHSAKVSVKGTTSFVEVSAEARDPESGMSTSTTTLMDFPPTVVGTPSTAIRNFRVNSTGENPLEIRGVTIEGSSVFSLVSTTCKAGTSVAPGSSCVVAIRFTPMTEGVFQGAVRVDTNVSTARISVRGTSGYEIFVQNATLFEEGDITADAQYICDGKARCDYLPYEGMGLEPETLPFAENIRIEYKCGESGTTRVYEKAAEDESVALISHFFSCGATE